jgi:hypothetical protein
VNSSLSVLASGPNLQREFPGKDRKKAKVKKPAAVPKPRTIKFHEYKVLFIEVLPAVFTGCRKSKLGKATRLLYPGYIRPDIRYPAF